MRTVVPPLSRCFARVIHHTSSFNPIPYAQERCLGGQHYSCFYWDGSALRVRPEAEIAHADAASAAAATADAAAGPGPAAVAARAGRAGEGGVLQLPSREDLAAAADVAVEAVEAEVVIAASGSA